VEAETGEGSVAARGLEIHTTLHPVLQRLAERAVAEGAAELDAEHPKAKGAQIALVAVRVRDGAVVAMVGGRDYGQSQFNRTMQGRRQLGSTVKPLTYLAAFDGDATLSPVSIVEDAPVTRQVSGKTWSPKNYDGTYKGPVTYRDALAASRNIPAVLVAEQVGMSRLQRFWKGLGLQEASALPSASLGAFGATPLEVATAYTVFPGQGKAAPAHLVRGVIDEDGKDRWPSPAPPVSHASERAAFLATRLLERVVTNGTGRGAAKWGLAEGVGGKTGTTDNARDAWFAGFTDELAVAVWVGFDKSKDVGLTGSKAALPTWSRFVSWSGTAGPEFSPPSSVVQMTFCPADNQPAGEPVVCEGAYTEFVSESAPPVVPKRQADGSVVEDEPGLIGRAWDRITGEPPEPTPAPPPAEPSDRKRWWRRSGGG
jgi:membrane peptidoglycan carboxypeptidase